MDAEEELCEYLFSNGRVSSTVPDVFTQQLFKERYSKSDELELNPTEESCLSSGRFERAYDQIQGYLDSLQSTEMARLRISKPLQTASTAS